MPDLTPLNALTPADAAMIAQDLTSGEGLPPGFDLPEYVEEFGGSLRYGGKTAGLKVTAEGRFAIQVDGPPSVAGRELGAELFGMFLFLGVTGCLRGADAGQPVALAWARRTPEQQRAAAAFARELLVPGPTLANLVDFYGFGEPAADAKAGAPAPRRWQRRDLEFLAGLFEVTPACIEVRLVEEGLLQPAAA